MDEPPEEDDEAFRGKQSFGEKEGDVPGWMKYVEVKEGEDVHMFDMHGPMRLPNWAPRGVCVCVCVCVYVCVYVYVC